MDGAGTNEKSRRSDESASESASRGMKKDAATRGRVQENKMLAELAKRKRFVRTSEETQEAVLADVYAERLRISASRAVFLRLVAYFRVKNASPRLGSGNAQLALARAIGDPESTRR